MTDPQGIIATERGTEAKTKGDLADGGAMTVTTHEPEPDRFVIEDDSQAAWAMRKLRDLRRSQTEINAVVLSEVEAINEWAERQRGKLDRDLEHFENLLIEYATKQREVEGRKTIDLPTGRVTSRLSTESWTVKPEFTQWAKDFAPDLVRQKVTESPETVEVLKEHLEFVNGKVIKKETGEIVEGIEIKTPTVNYKVETEK